MREILLENIHADYGNKEILKGISQHLADGEIVALIGPNGAGKSTLLKVIAGLLIPTAGRICIDGQEITTLPSYERVKLGVSFFVQGGRVFPNLSVKENLKIAANTVPSNEQKRNLKDILSLFPQLEVLFDRRAGLLSGGERQGLALAMAIIKRPRWLLLDEPSASLSPSLVHQTFLKLKEVSKQWGLSILIAEQNIIEATKLAQRVLVMSDGQIHLKSDSTDMLLADDQLAHVFLGKRLKEL